MSEETHDLHDEIEETGDSAELVETVATDDAPASSKTEPSLWRDALTQRDHALYKAAWTVFMRGMNGKAAGERLSDQKEEVIEFLYSLLDDEYLYEKEAPGGGLAPVNAIALLSEWKVREALPRFFAAIEDSVSSQPIYGEALEAIRGLGSDVLEDVLQWAEDNADLREEASHILGEIGQGDERVFNAILSWIEPEEHGHSHIIEHLIDIDPDKAVSALYALSTNRNFSKEERNVFRDKQKDARRIAKDRRKIQNAHIEAAAEEEEAVPSE